MITIAEISPEALEAFFAVSKATGEGLTHLIQPTCVKRSSIEGEGRFALKFISKGKLVGVVGGVLTGAPDNKIALPVGKGAFLNQLFMNHRALTNHSCNPSLKLAGFNRLVARSDIPPGGELTVDYGSLSVGDGDVIIENCRCGFSRCRKVIKNNDYLSLTKDELGAYPLYAANVLSGGSSGKKPKEKR